MNKKIILIALVLALIVGAGWYISFKSERKSMPAISGGVSLPNQIDIIYSGTVSLTKPANSTGSNAVVSHGLDQIPMVLSYFTSNTTNDGIYFQTPYIHSEPSTGITSLIVRVQSNATDITFTIYTPNVTSASNYYSTERTFTFHYFILRQPANQ